MKTTLERKTSSRSLERESFKHLEELARLIRYYILVATTEAGSGHPTSSLSATELMTGLLFGGMFRYDVDNPGHPNNDRLIFSKGHASPLFYALWAAAGKISENQMLTYRDFGSVLEGHPTPALPYVEAATGSLGQGLSIGLGMALNAKYLDQLPYRTYVLLGDSEMAEGSQWEAIQLAAHYQLDNLIGVLDVNRLGQRGETMYGHDIEAHARRIRAFGWETVCIDGHSFRDILAAYKKVSKISGRPVMIIAKTIKGKGVSEIEDKDGWHGKALDKDECKRALDELGEVDKSTRGTIPKPQDIQPQRPAPADAPPLQYEKEAATRVAFGNSLRRLYPQFPQIVSLDGEVSNSTMSEQLKKEHAERFFEMYIAEQNMVGAALGLSRRGKIPFVSTFAAFMTRAFDQIRMAQYSDANIKFVGSHAGVSIGEDGPSQMGLEDIAMFRTILHGVVLHPCDAISTEKLVEQAARHVGIVYLRTMRQKTTILYKAVDEFPIGGSKVLRENEGDVATVIAAGATVHEALEAHETLKKEGIFVRVIDAYSIKPLDEEAIRQAAQQTGLVVTVEDHFAEGGLGEAVSSALSMAQIPVSSLAVRQKPKSGKPEELRHFEGISADAIVREIRERLRHDGSSHGKIADRKQTIPMNPLKRLGEYGQAIWLDDIHRDLIISGGLKRLIDEDGLRGMTSNPAIFEKAIGHSSDYDDDIHALQRKPMKEIFEALAVKDVQMAADVFRPVFDRTGGDHGFVSLEVNPHLARDTGGTIDEARRLWKSVGRPNVFIKVPATKEGLPAIEQLISEGLNINITLLFGLPRYSEVAHAYVSGLENRAQRGEPLDRVRSVASFFLSRIDVLLDPRFEEMAKRGGEQAALGKELRGEVAIASARMAYQIYREIFAGDRWRKLADSSAHPQRLLWASTGTKNPDYSDVKYVEPLIGANTINTVPMETLEAYRDHGKPQARLEENVDHARRVMEQLPKAGIDIDQATQQLEDEAIKKFCKPFDALLETLEKKVAA